MDITGYFMIRKNYEESLQKEIENAVLENGSLNKYIQSFRFNDQLGENIEDRIVQILNGYTINKQFYLEVYRNKDVLIYSNAIKRIEEIQATEGKVGTVIVEEDNEKILYTSSEVKLEENSYQINTSKNITSIYVMRDKQIQDFLKISLSLTLFVALILAFFVYWITKRIRRLQKQVMKVAEGNYHITYSRVKGNDEIATLQKGFYEMIQSIKENIEKIERISENRKDFISNITHEIRSPLTAVIGFADLLENMGIEDRETIKKYAGKIYQEGMYIERMTQSLLQMVLLENQHIEKSRSNLSEVIKSAVSIAEDILINRNIKIETEIEEEVYQYIEPNLIESFVINLMKNSAKAIETENGIIKVSVNQKQLVVEDNGKGIPKKEIARVMEPFYTMDKSRNRKSGNMGLGLALCKKIAEIHEAEIRMESELGKGTRVVLDFEAREEKRNEK